MSINPRALITLSLRVGTKASPAAVYDGIVGRIAGATPDATTSESMSFATAAGLPDRTRLAWDAPHATLVAAVNELHLGGGVTLRDVKVDVKYASPAHVGNDGDDTCREVGLRNRLRLVDTV